MQCQVASLWDTCEEALQHSNCGLGAMPLAAFWANRFFTILLVTITNVRQWFQYWIQSCDLQDIDIIHMKCSKGCWREYKDSPCIGSAAMGVPYWGADVAAHWPGWLAASVEHHQMRQHN